ncbi:hypothetical protein PR048_009721 [Dryococelus australis]|uniref:Uncharacterized protein n=1 Tax=Dryococelus australis TaxID=614101 RepID=A0ABQ9I2J0_9NEOP|nr:hypothetical protein PR048_009721 [Dryococelus australis]
MEMANGRIICDCENHCSEGCDWQAGLLDQTHLMMVKRGKFGATPEYKGRKNLKFSREPTNQRHHLAQFPCAKIWEQPCWEPSLVQLCGRQYSWLMKPQWCSGQTTCLSPKQTGFDSRGVTPGFLHVGIMPDDATCLSCSPVLHSGAALYSSLFIHICSQDLDFKSCPNLSTLG